MSVLAGCLIGMFLVNEVPQTGWEKAKIVSVMTTDTVVVEVAENPSLWVNLLGVGTPDSVDSRKETFLLGKPDINWLEKWIPPGTPVWMERRGATITGRPIVFLYRLDDGFCWNAFLVKTGAAYAREQLPFAEFSKLVSYEAQAKEKKVGLWEGYKPVVVAAPPIETSPRRIQTVFTPPNFVAPRRRTRPRYASQAAARAELDMMMGLMMMGSPYGSWADRTVSVRGYYRSNGTWVNPYMRRPPGMGR